MLKCVLTKVAAAAAVAVGGVGLGAYYETDGEILSAVGMDCGHTCPLSAMMSSCGSAEATCPLTPSAGCCHAAEVAADLTADSLGAALGGCAFASKVEAAPAPKEVAVSPEPAATSDAAQQPQ